MTDGIVGPKVAGTPPAGLAARNLFTTRAGGTLLGHSGLLLTMLLDLFDIIVDTALVY